MSICRIALTFVGMECQFEFNPRDYPHLKEALILLAEDFDLASVYDSQGYEDPYGKYEILAAFGARRVLEPVENPIEELRDFHEKKPSWLFGYFNFDLKNYLEKLSTNHPQQFNFQPLFFYEPELLFVQKRKEDKVQVYYQGNKEPQAIDDLLSLAKRAHSVELNFPAMQAKMTRESYLEAVRQLKREIQLGNIYEINYCQEFYTTAPNFNPYQSALALKEKSRMPYSCFFKQHDHFLLGASPERYLKKTGNTLISQPIKGTAKRGKDKVEDEAIKMALKNDLKEQTENVMIVDLVRNDLSRTAAKGSVQVKELFGVYTFPQVHQLISTIQSQLKAGVHFTEALKLSFPMGSMTGAPKIAALKLIDQYEKSRRELYSGSVAYIEPNGDFDFNVVIRSLLYRKDNGYLSLTVGGAITDMADPEKEYEECLLKAKAIFDQIKKNEGAIL